STKGSEAYALSQSQRLERTQDRKRAGNKVRYNVRRGDTFWDIARDHRVTVREVAAWNGMAPGDPLIPGKELVIWSKTAQPTTTASNTRSKAMVRKVGYRVRSGDSLSTIASRFSVNVRDIASWNDLNTSRKLQAGQRLVLYVDIRTSPYRARTMTKTRKAPSLTGRITSLALMATPLVTSAEQNTIETPEPVHGIAMHGDVKYPENFSHFDYVNPQAPKGGQLNLSVVSNGFDSFNPYVVRGVAAAGINTYVYD